MRWVFVSQILFRNIGPSEQLRTNKLWLPNLKCFFAIFPWYVWQITGSTIVCKGLIWFVRTLTWRNYCIYLWHKLWTVARINSVRYEIIKAVLLKFQVSWDVTQSSWTCGSWYFKGSQWLLHFQGRAVQEDLLFNWK